MTSNVVAMHCKCDANSVTVMMEVLQLWWGCYSYDGDGGGVTAMVNPLDTVM